MNTIEALAAKYVRETEEFDRTVCTGRKNGIAMPESGKQLAAISQNARNLNAQCLAVVMSMGYTEEDWNRSRQFAIRKVEDELRSV